MRIFVIGLLLFAVALLLLLPLSLINFALVATKGKGGGYFMSTAVNLDRFGNHEFRTLFNTWLIRPESVYRFGDFRETISSVLGKNQRAGTLSRSGQTLAHVLDFIDKGHCINSIIET